MLDSSYILEYLNNVSIYGVELDVSIPLVHGMTYQDYVFNLTPGLDAEEVIDDLVSGLGGGVDVFVRSIRESIKPGINYLFSVPDKNIFTLPCYKGGFITPYIDPPHQPNIYLIFNGLEILDNYWRDDLGIVFTFVKLYYENLDFENVDVIYVLEERSPFIDPFIISSAILAVSVALAIYLIVKRWRRVG